MAGVTLGLFAALAIYTHERIHENTERHRQQLADQFLRRTASSAVYAADAGLRFVEAALADQRAKQAAAQAAQLAARKGAEAQAKATPAPAPAAPQAAPEAAPVTYSGSAMDYEAYIRQIFPQYGLDPAAGIRVMYCESSGNAHADNGVCKGLFQYNPGTWSTTPEAGNSIWDPYAQIRATAWMWSVGRRGEWTCQ